MASVLGRFITFIILCTIIVSSAATPISKRQLPCDHPLRVPLPHLFSHCMSACTYTAWSTWQVVRNSSVSVPTSQCSSGQAYSERRTRAGIGSECTESTSETRSICKPDREDSMILALGLGHQRRSISNANDNSISSIISSSIISSSISSTTIQGGRFRFNDTIRQARQINSVYCPTGGKANHVCSNFLEKRSIHEDDYAQEMHDQIQASPQLQEKTDSISAPLDSVPIQFDWKEHGNHLMRHRRQLRCSSSIQHVLFMLDSSGSIGQRNYDRMKTSVASLISLFCKEVHFALLTFSTHLNLDFCFDCYGNNRVWAAQAILNSTYQNGWTNTGAATKCICNHLLHPNCGISVDPNCLDVIFITDGKSNDPTLEVCDEVACLHNLYGVNTYAVGIDGFNQHELRCISDQSDMFNQFDYTDFDDFERSINEIANRLASQTSKYACTLPKHVLP